MPTQAQTNNRWHVEGVIPGPDGALVSITCLEPPVRRPGRYQYTISPSQAEGLKRELKARAKRYDPWMQCMLLTFKKTVKGFRLDLFLLGYRPGLCDGAEGVTWEQWHEATSDFQAVLKWYLGNDAPMYIEPWDKDKKFQARFETYVEVK